MCPCGTDSRGFCPGRDCRCPSMETETVSYHVQAWADELTDFSDSHTSIGPFNSLLAAWLVMEVVVDASIAGILIYKLSMSKTGHKNSDSVLNRLIRMSVQTGKIFCHVD